MIRYALSICFLITFCLNSAGYINLPGLQTLEDKIYDFRLNVTRPNNSDPRVIILDIDEKSLKELGRWPWDRKTMAQLLDILFDEYYIQALGLDILFAEEDNSSGLQQLQALANGPLQNDAAYKTTLQEITPELDYDGRFAQAMTDRDVIMGFFFRNQAQDKLGYFNIGQLPQPVPIANQEKVGEFLPSAKGYGANLPQFQAQAVDAGFIDNPSISPDGIIRKVPLIQKYDSEIYQSLSLGLIRALYGFPPIKLEYTDEKVLIGISIDQNFIPTTYLGEVYVPYRGDFPSYTYISVSDVLNKKVKPETLDGAIVLMGTSATGLLDMRATPVNNIFPGVEIHANVVSGILDNAIKYEPFDLQGLDFLLHLFIGLVLIFTLPRLKVISSIAITSLFAGSMIALNYYFWQQMQMIMPVVSVLTLIVFIFMLHISYGYFVEDRNKRKLAGLFGQYVPPELVDEMSKSSDKVTLEGETKELSILFSDIRGFTTLSENMDPRDLTSLMNQYLTVMTEIILKNRGTIDKYIGDAIMAFWGAPVSDNEHAEHAVQAAADMQAALPELNKKFRQQGFPEISIGIGVNSGK
ncbi:MAG: adenylate/guanylate cyclase domain-containing protein, partial [Gammaproteobacteria bacterium]|nr:adenylate/guanylate cyclase domain-containing protein [Gammaproteobacteria bacterium]